jgi:hypothetical protein
MSRKIIGLFSYGKRTANDIQTPPDLYNLLNEEFGPFGGDPSPLGGVEYMDGLTLDWPERTFVNPPYNQIPKWIDKAIEEKAKGKLVVMLIPARVKSKYWFDNIWPEASEIRFFRKVIFHGFTEPSPMPIACVIFKPNKEREEYTHKKGRYKWVCVK